jgi:hypothetical protein
MSPKRKKVSQFIIMGETQFRLGGFELLWLWIASEPETHVVLRTKILKERNTFVGNVFCWTWFTSMQKNPVSTDGGGIWSR